MKVKVISRSTDDFTRERSQDLHKVFRNYDPNLRTQEKAIEYTRALNAAKLEKIFARPLIGAMDGHIDAISCMAKNPNHLKGIFSGSMDGDIRLWDMATRRTTCRFNGHQGPVRGLTVSTDGNVLVSCGNDCSVKLWKVPSTFESSDTVEDDEPLANYVWKYAFRAVDHQWESNIFATGGANEDCNCYSYDARKLDEAKCVHQDHVSAVMDIDYSPTGREFVTGSYDRTVRIFRYNGGHSREIYHTKRMQRVFCVKYSCDGTYVISGSDDTNLRLWKANASEQLGVLLPRERKKQEYLDAVKNRYKHLPDVKRIVRHRHLPKPIYKAAGLRRTMVEAERRKDERRRAHSAPGSTSVQPFRKRRIIQEIE
ncbi:Sof1-like rRNA processing protein (contains WD40 repeats) protein [Dioscorea alata]|uniref:Sof1-like rRNA processing protein (Contains WD40 repeats) protein n=1 Tax=Dioscorea alata TaxID=55571 RepID=A0ACB7TTI2_DIOAL|nr:Sof1-like rRNA processing protein (contains WD40 repeats) protein [Dioscorea alata]